MDLPKIELHAHLNGSLSEKTLKTLGCLNENISEYQRLTKLLQTTNKTLSECFELFKIAQNATNNPKSLYTATRDVIEEFANDNVIYLELRTTPRAQTAIMSKSEYIETVVKAIEDSQSHPNGIIVKLLLSIDRRHDQLTSNEAIRLIVEMKTRFPDIIRGVDLSGSPYEGSFDTNLFNYARNNGLFTTIHCAEIRNDEESVQVIDFRPDRLRHGTYLGADVGVWELYKKSKIPLEFCLTSNIVCGTVKSYEDHHLQQWLNNNLPFSLNTDDKGVFCTNLSREFILAKQHFNLTDQDLWNISNNSVDYSFASSQEKLILKKRLRSEMN